MLIRNLSAHQNFITIIIIIIYLIIPPIPPVPDFLREQLHRRILRYRVSGHNTTKLDTIYDLNFYGNIILI